MSPGTRGERTGARGVLLVVVLLAALLLAIDLVRPDSFLRGLWDQPDPTRSRLLDLLDVMRSQR